MNWGLVLTVNDIPKLCQRTTREQFDKDRQALLRLGIVLSLNEYNSYGYTDNEGKAVVHHLTIFKEPKVERSAQVLVA